MLRDNRRQQIYELLQKSGEVQTTELCRVFQVSDMTIRRDLQSLEQERKIIRTHGGAILPAEKMSGAGDELETAKEKIAKKGLGLVQGLQKIFIDSGTTTSYVAANLPEGKESIVGTNNLRIVKEVSSNPFASVLIIGGAMRKETLSCYGTQAEEQIRRYRVDVAFLGAAAVGRDGYIYDGYAPEEGVKKSIIQSAARTYVLVDSSKFGHYGLITYSHVNGVEGVITDSGIDPEILKRLRDMGANVIIAE